MKRRTFLAFAGALIAEPTLHALADSAHARGYWQVGPFVRPSDGQPLIRPNPEAEFNDPVTNHLSHWEASHTFNPAAIAWNDKLYVLFRAEGTDGDAIGGYTSRVGLAESTDGVHFSVLPHPVLYPRPGRWQKDQWPGGCEDPRLVQAADGTFVLTYTMWNRKIARLGVATSKDLISWTCHGPAFDRAYRGRFADTWSKSGAVVTQLVGSRVVAAKIRGRYWMYWHTQGQTYLAYSDDLIKWTPVLDRASKLMCVLPKNKPGHFDSWLTESGPPALLTDHGIVFFYNGMSDGKIARGPHIPARRYSAGQALFGADDPARLLQRPSEPYFWPELSWEKSGQYKPGTTFTEGLARFRDRWYLFYGGADTVVGMAVAR